MAERLKIIRIKQGISQKELAKKINGSNSHICMWERGKMGISLRNFLDLAKALNVSTEDLNPRNEITV